MALVPLEERLQSKEKAWESERRELVLRAEESSRAAKTTEERSRELEKRKTEMEEERCVVVLVPTLLLLVVAGCLDFFFVCRRGAGAGADSRFLRLCCLGLCQRQRRVKECFGRLWRTVRLATP